MVPGFRPGWRLAVLPLLGLLGAAEEAPAPDEAALGKERDALIAKIAGGSEVEASVRAFGKLLRRRDEILAATRAAAERQAREEATRQAAAAQAAAQAEARRRQAEAEAQRKTALEREAEAREEAARRAYLASLDHLASKYCHLCADPRSRHFGGGLAADWGRVGSRTVVRIPARRALDDDQEITLYEIRGQRDRHVVRGDEAKGVKLDVGALVFLCYGPGNHDRHLPPPWDQERLTSLLYGGPIAAPPRIAAKARWDPIHVTLNDLWHAIRDQEWRFPAGRSVVANLRLGDRLGPDRFTVAADDAEVTFVLEVPPGLPRRELLVPGAWVWVIMEKPRFDRGLKSLVLVAADVESRYIVQ